MTSFRGVSKVDGGNESDVVMLTFDDGPHGTLTPKLLDILGARGAKATFFVMGTNARQHPDIIQRMVRLR